MKSAYNRGVGSIKAHLVVNSEKTDSEIQDVVL